MATVFLLGFSRAVVRQLVSAADVELSTSATEEDVSYFVAEFLGSREPGHSLISTLAAALVACPSVVELFADDERLKEVVDDVPSGALPR